METWEIPVRRHCVPVYRNTKYRCTGKNNTGRPKLRCKDISSFAFALTMDTCAFCFKTLLYWKGNIISPRLARCWIYFKPAPPYINGVQIRGDRFRGVDLHLEMMNQSVVLCAACLCYPLSRASPLLQKMLFPVDLSIVFLGVFFVSDMAQDIFLDKVIAWRSSIEIQATYKGGPGLAKRILDSWSTMSLLFLVFNLGFFFQEMEVGNFKHGA